MKPLYIVAVSGGVDSVVLLHQLVRANDARLIIAHVDHGIRAESGEDARFVAELAREHNLPLEQTKLQLGSGASEAIAREKRWEFLRFAKDKHGADAIVTAHHADDVIETMMINVIRGTGWRGLASLRETLEIKRPLLDVAKQEIIAYAREHQLTWHEDATNQDMRYLRNMVRHQLLPRCDETMRNRWLELYRAQCRVRDEIEAELNSRSWPLTRYFLTMVPDEVAYELLRQKFGALEGRELKRVLLFVRTGRAGTQLRLTTGEIVHSRARELIVLGAQG